MKLNRIDTKKAIRFLKTAIGKNESRANLMNVHVQAKGNACIMTAADAYHIKRVHLELQTHCNVKPFLIPGSVIDIFNGMINAKHKRRIDTIDINRYMLRCDDKSIRYKQPNCNEYPNLDKLINGGSLDGDNVYEEKRESLPVGVNPYLLRSCMSGFETWDVMKMECAGPEQPVRFSSQDGKYISILMPVRLRW